MNQSVLVLDDNEWAAVLLQKFSSGEVETTAIHATLSQMDHA